MELFGHLQALLYALFVAIFIYMREAWQWWLGQVLSVPWGRVGELPGSKVVLLIASAGIVAYFLFRAARELYSAGEKAFSAFVTLMRVLAKTVPPLLFAALASAAGAWVVNHVNFKRFRCAQSPPLVFLGCIVFLTLVNAYAPGNDMR